MKKDKKKDKKKTSFSNMLCNIGIMKITESFHMRYMNQSTLKKEVKKEAKKLLFSTCLVNICTQ